MPPYSVPAWQKAYIQVWQNVKSLTCWNPEFKRSYNGIEQWEYKKLHFISGAVTTILLDFQHDKVISFNSYAGDTPSPAYPPIAICPPAPVEEIPSLAYPTDDQKWFQELYQKVKDKPFKDERLKILREAASQSDFTCDEIVQLMKIFNFDDERLEALAILEPTIIDRENTDRIVDSMTFISGEEKAKIYWTRSITAVGYIVTVKSMYYMKR